MPKGFYYEGYCFDSTVKKNANSLTLFGLKKLSFFFFFLAICLELK